MSEESKIDALPTRAQSRRAFVKTAAQVAVTAPAAVMLLSASPARADVIANPYSLGDDATTNSDDQGVDDVFVTDPGDDLIP